MKRHKQKEKALQQAIDALHDVGYNVICVTAKYSRKKAHFSTRFSVKADKKAGVTEDHIVLDVQREIVNNWSNAVH